MDLAHKHSSFATSETDLKEAGASASAILTAEVANELLTSSDVPGAVLAGALQESMRQFESLLACVSGTFYRGELCPPWKMDFFGTGIEAIAGYGPEFFLARPYGDIIEPDDLPALQATVEQAVARHEHFTACYRIRHKSGAVRWVSERGTAVYSADGDPRFLEGFITDITEAKALELQAQMAHAKIAKLNSSMSRILESTPDCVISVDRDWNFNYFNKRACLEVADNLHLSFNNSLDSLPNIKQSSFWQALRTAMELREEAQAEGYVAEIGKWYDLLAMPNDAGITVFFRDISKYKKLEQALASQAEDLRTTLDSIPYMVWSAPPDGNTDYYNRSWFEFIGHLPVGRLEIDDAWGNGLFHPDDWPEVKLRWGHAVATGDNFELEYRLRHNSGEYRWLLGRAQPLRDQSGTIIRWYGTCTDIHERILAERSLRESKIFQSNILNASVDCIKTLSLDGTLIQISDPGLRAMEIDDRNLVIGIKWADLWPGKGKPAARRAIRTARAGKTARFTGFCPTAKGTPHWWDNIVTPITGDDGNVRHILCVSRNITEQRRSADRLRVASEHDALTSLPNRGAFEAYLKQATDRALDSRTNIGLMLLDLDHFKHVNDTLGHLAGDHLLRVLAKRLKNSVSGLGFVARLGGDEFAIVLEGVSEEKELVSAATQVHARLEKPVTYSGKLINGGLSIGCAMFPRDATDAHGLFKHADTALYDLKAGGRGGIQMFCTRMVEAAERTASQLNLARRVIHDDAVEPYYQPKVRLDTGDVVGFEALLRWWSPSKGIQPPSSVAEAFNDYELAAKIGNLMQHRVFEDIYQWLAAGLTPFPVSINAAPAEFLRDDYAERLFERLAEHDVPRSLIEVEITEHVFLERRSEHVVRALRLLNESGIRIALDDFGTGHSSLSHLRDFPVDVLKLDRSFISRMMDEPAMMAIVRAMARLGTGLSLDIVAEGVETSEQLQALRDASCGFGQGYLFGKAMDFGEIAKRLAVKR